MKTLVCIALLGLFTSGICVSQIDTLRRKDSGDREFIQVRRGNTVLSEGYLSHNKPEGVWVQFQENGYPHIITSWHNGQKNGIYMEINPQGYTDMTANYKDDLLEGPRRLYRSGSTFLSEEVYYSEGKKHGSFSKRYTSGKPQEDSNYNMDVRDGKTTWYYESGEQAAVYHYRNGVLEGEAATFHPNGKVSEAGIYKDNEQTGVWKEFYDNGKIKAEGTYIKGKKDGAWKTYDESGKLLSTYRYRHGKKQ